MRYITLILAVLLFSAQSCRKSDRDTDDSVLASSDQVMADAYLGNAFVMIDEAAKLEYGLIPTYTTGYLSCATVTSNLFGTPNTMTIDFGSACSGPDERVRSGQIYAQISNGTYGDSAVVVSVNFINYMIDDIEIDGSLTIRFNGDNTEGNPENTMTFTDLEFIHSTPDWTAYLTGAYIRELISGGGDFDVSNDSYSIRGTGSGRSRSGNYFDVTILTNLDWSNSCQYVQSGTMEIAPDNLVPRSLDYGSGTCDSNVVVTFNQTQYYVAQP